MRWWLSYNRCCDESFGFTLVLPNLCFLGGGVTNRGVSVLSTSVVVTSRRCYVAHNCFQLSTSSLVVHMYIKYSYI